MSVLIIFCLASFVTSETQVHRVYVAKKSSDSTPTEASFVYKQVKNNPARASASNSDWTTSETTSQIYSEQKLLPIQYHPIDFSKQTYQSSLSKRDVIDKAESKFNTNFLPSKKDTDAMYERLKTAMDYRIPDDSNEIIDFARYDSHEYHTDDDDVRTSSRGVYDNWPSYHHNHYEYELAKIDSETEKAKDKRYAADTARKIIPIHEDLSDDTPNYNEYVFTTDYYRQKATDNPMTGHDPFFSFVLNDYFDKNNYDDHISLKGIQWGNDFDLDDYARKNRHLDIGYQPVGYETGDSHSHHHKVATVDNNDIAEKGISEQYNSSKHQKRDNENTNDKTKYEQNEHNRIGFKDFVNSFASKFGSEDNKKDSQYVSKKNQENGEKRKGFHRVYHKDEYQEDKEFYNNNNNSIKSEEKNSADAHIKGSKGFQSSHAAESLGNKSDTFNKAGNAEKNRFEDDTLNTRHNNSKGFVGHFNKYRDVAKQTALSNNADYSDHYRI